MEGERNPNDVDCRGGCGYFGSSATNGLCSVCYKQQLARTNAGPASTSLCPAQPMDTLTLTPSTTAAAASFTQDILQVAQGMSMDFLERTTSVEQLGHGSMLMSESEAEGDEGKVGIKKKSTARRCASCRKKVGLLGFECRCGQLFCGTHRYSDKHDCSFDYREYGKNEIQKNNPVVVAEKIKKL